MFLQKLQSILQKGLYMSSVVANTSSISPVDEIASSSAIVLSPEQKQEVAAIRAKIDTSNVLTVIVADEHITEELVEFNNKILSAAKTADIPDLSELIATVRNGVVELDPSIINGKPSLLQRIFGAAKDGLQKYNEKYDTINDKFNKVKEHVRENVEKGKKDFAAIEELFAINYRQFKGIEVLIYAFEEELQQMRDVELPKYVEAASTNEASAVNALREYQNQIRVVEKKIYSLNVRRLSVIQTAQIISDMRNNIINTIINSTELLVNGIEEWRKNVSIEIINYRTRSQADDNKGIIDLANGIQKRSAERLRDNSIEITKLAERGTTDYETLKFVNDKLIDTIKETKKIIDDADTARHENIKKIKQLEVELKAAVSEYK